MVGFRYFNVYGPREQHKGRMASVAFHQFNQFREEGKVKLFGDYGGYGPGQQERDFVFVDDVVAVNLWFFDHPDKRGLFNLGTGRAQPFNDVATAVVSALTGKSHTARFGRRGRPAGVHRLPRCAARQVPVPHAGRPGRPARGRLRPPLRRCADRRRELHGLARQHGLRETLPRQRGRRSRPLGALHPPPKERAC